MRELLDNEIDPKEIPLSDIILSYTNDKAYDAERGFLIDTWSYVDVKAGYVIVEGEHCSCYGFDNVKWNMTAYEPSELVKVSKGRIEEGYYNPEFWKMVLKYLEEY